jgi:hypothetical protein
MVTTRSPNAGSSVSLNAGKRRFKRLAIAVNLRNFEKVFFEIRLSRGFAVGRNHLDFPIFV